MCIDLIVRTAFLGHALKVTLKAFAMKACSAMDTCFVVQVSDKEIATLYGGGTAGSMFEDQVQIYNISAMVGHTESTQVFIKKSNPATINACLLGAAVQDLIVADYGPPFGDTFETDAAAPTVDGVELKVPLSELVRGDPPKGIAMLGGSNMDEGTEFMSLCPEISCNASVTEFSSWAVEKYGAHLGAKVPALYAEIDRSVPLLPVCLGFPQHLV